MEGEKRKPDAEASSSTISKRQRPSDERESGSPLPDSPEKINEPSESEANSEPRTKYANVIGNNYYVFLSFRGPDTRKGFVDHLYHELVRVGLHLPNFVFRDEENLNLGEPIEMILSAIKCSKVSIPVISETYAASEWCLREIIQIMECEKSGQQKVYPVLYKVTPGDVRDMKGKFGDAFRCRKHVFDKEVKRNGPVALRDLVNCKVYESEKDYSGYEGKLVKQLVRIIMDRRQDFLPPFLGNLVGMDDRVSAVMKLVDTNPSVTQIIGIHGIGGIGKTTLVTNIYDELSKKFEHRSFLMDIRETINRKGIEHIQSLLSSDITKNHESRVRDSVSGIKNVQFSCANKKVLIILDDVDHREHLDKLIDHNNFISGSRIIITCRDKAILKPEYKTYELKELEGEDRMRLFSSYAYEEKEFRPELGTLPWDIVATTGGLPLALKIIGSLLKGKVKSIWTETLQKLSRVPHTNVQQKLRTSYDSLEYEQQQMFLDIACFFIGTNKRFAAYLWKDLQYFPDSGLERMIELSLMKIDDNNMLRMHDELRDLGRAIACPANKKAWKCSRLWDEKAIIIQRSKEENRYIEALRLDENGSNMFMNQRSFKRMPYLKFLHLKVDFVENFEDSLSELRWLKWEKCPNSFGVTNLHLEKLLILDLSYGYIRHEWRGWSSIKMERLKVLNLSHCFDLVITPNLSAFKNLEILILEYCRNLEKIDPSIGDAKCLTSLNLSNCWSLRELPDLISHLVNLSTLDLRGCSELQKLPDSISHLVNLLTLDLRGCSELQKLPDSISNLVNLSTLDLRFCEKFEGFPESIGSLVKLQHLLLGNMALQSEDWYSEFWECDGDYCFDRIPHSIGKLQSLTELHFTCAKISELPESIRDLKSLKILKIAKCRELRSLPSAISNLTNLEELDAAACDILEGPVPINGLSSLKILRLGKLGRIGNLYEMHEAPDDLSSEDFSELSSQQDPDSLTDLEITSHNRILPQLSHLSSQQHLDLTNCYLPASLTVLEITSHNCRLPQLSHLSKLKELTFQFCELLESIPELPSGILDLWVFWCVKLKELPSLSNLGLLSNLHIMGCGELMEIKGLEGLTSLQDLSICGCMKLRNLNGLKHLESLRELQIQELDDSIMNDHEFQVQCLGRLENLETLRIIYCQSLTRLDISQLTRLESLGVYQCEELVKIEGLDGLKNLRGLTIDGCDSIETLPPRSLFDNLKYPTIEGCPKLRDVQDWRN